MNTIVHPQPQRWCSYWLWLNGLYTDDELRQRLDWRGTWHWRIKATPKPIRKKRNVDQ